METRILTDQVDTAVELLRGGKLVAVPTETVYGLAGNGLDEEAVAEIYRVKGRSEGKPLSLLVEGSEALDRYCSQVPYQARFLALHFWPGPLTMVLKAREQVPALVRAGGESVGLRCPDHPLTLALLRRLKLPLAAPSANPSGAPSPKSARAVLDYFDGKIPAVLDGGDCGLGQESTVVDLSTAPFRILRQGALAREAIVEELERHVLKIGITGGSGCGKTTALRELEKLGALVLDCDEIYHALLSEDEGLLSALAERFPQAVSRAGVDRERLGELVFSDPAALEDLNRISHKHVALEVDRRLRDWAMAGGQMAAIDAIELIGSGLSQRCLFTVGILADEETRIQRIMARDGINRERALLRIRAQRSDDYFIRHCDRVLYNNGDKADFAAQFISMLEEELTDG